MRVAAPNRETSFAGEGIDSLVNAGAYIAPGRHGNARAAPYGKHCADHLPEGNGKHEAANPPDKGRIALDNAFIDDAGVEAGQVQGGQSRGELQNNGQRNETKIGFRVFSD